MWGVNETKFLVHHQSYECKCRLNEIVIYSKNGIIINVELMVNKVNWLPKKKIQIFRQIHLFLASFRKLFLSGSHLKL